MDKSRNMNGLSLAVSVAEQNFHTATSLAIYNTALGLIVALARHPDARRVRILANRDMIGQLPRGDNVKVETYDYAAGGSVGRVWWEQVGVHRAVAGRNDDWLILPKGFAAFVTPCPIRLAVYVHDIMAAVLADRYPGTFPRAKQAYFAACYRASLKRARVVFTNTEFTRQELAHWATGQGLTCPPVRVVGHGVDPSSGDGVVAQKEDRILVFVRRSAHKRTDLAVRYVEQWRKDCDYKGSIVALGTLPEELRLPQNGRWTHEERVPGTRYVDLIRQSRVAVHFSEYEGFGLPPLDAVLAGTCPVYSDLPPEREVMVGAGCPFDNGSYDAFAGAMNRAMSMPREQVKTWADALRARHDWRIVSDRVVSALREFA
mgnify:CR=1 FL=1